MNLQDPKNPAGFLEKHAPTLSAQCAAAARPRNEKTDLLVVTAWKLGAKYGEQTGKAEAAGLQREAQQLLKRADDFGKRLAEYEARDKELERRAGRLLIINFFAGAATGLLCGWILSLVL